MAQHISRAQVNHQYVGCGLSFFLRRIKWVRAVRRQRLGQVSSVSPGAAIVWRLVLLPDNRRRQGLSDYAPGEK